MFQLSIYCLLVYLVWWFADVIRLNCSFIGVLIFHLCFYVLFIHIYVFSVYLLCAVMFLKIHVWWLLVVGFIIMCWVGLIVIWFIKNNIFTYNICVCVYFIVLCYLCVVVLSSASWCYHELMFTDVGLVVSFVLLFIGLIVAYDEHSFICVSLLPRSINHSWLSCCGFAIMF